MDRDAASFSNIDDHDDTGVPDDQSYNAPSDSEDQITSEAVSDDV
jgi:hypothetical protein